MLQVPSGRVLDSLDLRLIDLFVRYGFIRWSEKPFTLNSGVESHVYVFGREDLTDHPDFEWLMGRKIAELVLEDAARQGDKKQQCLIGLPTAGTALTQAAAMASWSRQSILLGGNHELSLIIHRIMREALKTHGVHPDWVNGKPQPDIHTYWFVDNVVTGGGTMLEAREKLRESGYPVETMPALVFVDRQQGGIANMQKAGFQNIVVAYNLLDLTYAYGELGLWPKDAVQAVKEEIRAHQLVA